MLETRNTIHANRISPRRQEWHFMQWLSYVTLDFALANWRRDGPQSVEVAAVLSEGWVRACEKDIWQGAMGRSQTQRTAPTDSQQERDLGLTVARNCILPVGLERAPSPKRNTNNLADTWIAAFWDSDQRTQFSWSDSDTEKLLDNKCALL